MASFILREPWDRSWGESAGVPALREDGLLEPSELDFKRFRRGKAGRALRGSNRGRWENSTEAKGRHTTRRRDFDPWAGSASLSVACPALESEPKRGGLLGSAVVPSAV